MSVKVLQSWGVASARHSSGTLVHCSHDDKDIEYLFDVPIGPSITRWDIVTGERSLTFQAHSDVVTSMRCSPDLRWVATASYNGEVSVWDREWKNVAKTLAPMGCQHHLAWSHDSERFIIIGKGPDSAVVMYRLATPLNEGEDSNVNLHQCWQVKAIDCEAGVKDDKTTPAFVMGEMMPSGYLLTVRERVSYPTYMQLWSMEGVLLKTTPVPCMKSGGVSVETMFISVHSNGCYAIGVQGGRVLMVKDDLTISATLNVGVTSRTCVWDGVCLVLPTDAGSLAWWSMEGLKVKELKFGSPDIIVRLDWSISGECLWVCSISSLQLLSVNRDEQGGVSNVKVCHVISSHEIACCGVDFTPSGRVLVSGDLAGNVWVTNGIKVRTAFKYNVSGSVRCVVWRSENVLFVGDLDGHVTRCLVGSAYTPVLQLDGSIITMAMDNPRKILAIGTSKGMLEVYSCLHEGLKVVSKVLAHPPKQGPQDERFGQLTKQAEVWSVCWSPFNDRIATCSEDQTTKIWNTSNWECVTILTGHTMAVTSVDWKDVGKESLIATCSDDRTVRLTEGLGYQLVRVLNTMDIYGWHTITYLSFSPAKDSPLLLCATQNGHVVVWDSLSGEKVLQNKIHLGSIEGVAWYEVGVATVGADCVVNMFTVDTN